VTDAVDAPARRWAALSGWARLGILALAVVIVVIVAIVVVRVVTRVPPIPLGTTAVGDLRPGSCLAEGDLGLEEYTVVPCSTEHPQQVFAPANLTLDDATYQLVGPSLATFGDLLCNRFVEYRLFLDEDLESRLYLADVIDVPDDAAYAAGDTEALCVIFPRESGAMLTGDLYRPMP
jgi:hypothetical protein